VTVSLAVLQNDLTEAMRARDELRTATLRLALTAIHAEEVAGKSKRELSDDEVLVVITREVKKRREAAAAFDEGNRPERAERERLEAAVLEGYVPAQLSDSDLDALVTEAVAASGASGPQGMGVAMKAAKAAVGTAADGGRIAAAVKRALAAG
jgi:uncharacterized protein YqeY